MTDNIFTKRDPSRTYLGFIAKRMFLMAITNCFRKIFMDFLHFAFISYTYFSPMT